MRLYLVAIIISFSGFLAAQSFENKFTRPLGETLEKISERFQTKFSCNIDTVGKVVPYADFRIRQYSLEESLTNVLSLFDYTFVKQKENSYKLKPYEYMRRTPADGEKLLAYLNTLYQDSVQWKSRKACLKQEVREYLKIDETLTKRIPAKPIYSKARKFDGYTVQNFSLETLPGLYVNGSIHTPASKGKHAIILCPNGHWADGRYNKDEQTRFATLARMGAICVSYDLFAWGESELQFGAAAHRSSVAHIIQIMNGITILDMMLSRKDVDPKRIGANGGSGGGSQVVLLSLLDERISAACPTVNLASHFDGGCPCESGMPVQLACGGTCNPELMAAFAPKPLCVISDGGDWTASVPALEYPYLQRIYGFYGANDKLSNIHLANEKHDFGVNKRRAVYDFFGKFFNLNMTMADEGKVTIEAKEALYSFGLKGEKMPVNALKNFKDLEKMFNKETDRELASNLDIDKKATEWTASLQLADPGKAEKVKQAILTHLKAVRDWHNNHPYTIVPEGINPLTGNPLTQLDREMIANSAKPKSIHENLMKTLRENLTEEQVELVLDKYTVGKVAFTLKGYQAIVPDLTEKETEFILKQLKKAREEAIDYKSMKAISGVFEIYKTKCEQYFNENGRNWRQLFKAFVDKRNAEKAAEKAKAAQQ
jgi:hypothetical protein